MGHKPLQFGCRKLIGTLVHNSLLATIHSYMIRPLGSKMFYILVTADCSEYSSDHAVYFLDFLIYYRKIWNLQLNLVEIGARKNFWQGQYPMLWKQNPVWTLKMSPKVGNDKVSWLPHNILLLTVNANCIVKSCQKIFVL